MNYSTYKVWEAFKGELTQSITDDMKEAFATAIREIANEYQYYNFCKEAVEDMIVDARVLYGLADEIDTLETDH